MTAQQAKQQALSIQEGTNKQAYQKAIAAIEKAVVNGKMECRVYDVIPIGVINELKLMGYAVKPDMDRNESYTTISWADA